MFYLVKITINNVKFNLKVCGSKQTKGAETLTTVRMNTSGTNSPVTEVSTQ
jgi:hypothetical protein